MINGPGKQAINNAAIEVTILSLRDGFWPNPGKNP
jgi:hypothetical protein